MLDKICAWGISHKEQKKAFDDAVKKAKQGERNMSNKKPATIFDIVCEFNRIVECFRLFFLHMRRILVQIKLYKENDPGRMNEPELMNFIESTLLEWFDMEGFYHDRNNCKD